MILGEFPIMKGISMEGLFGNRIQRGEVNWLKFSG